MRSRVHLAALAVAACVSTLAATALADLAPPPGFVETCTLDKQKGSDECYDCRAYHGNADHCSASLKDFGFAQKCRSRGASAWGEVWCRAPSASAKKVPPEILGQLANATNVVKPSGDAPPGAPLAIPPAAAGTVAPTPPVEPVATASPPTPPPPVPPSAGGCGACAAPGTPITPAVPAFAALAFVAAWALRRRR